jgi:hypothetical protein
MTYVGAVPTTGDFKKLDAITASATATYNLRQGGVAVYPQSSSHCLVVLNGILQTGGSSFNIVNDTIVFAEALTSSDVINQILVLGNVNDIGVPSDDTVSTAKLQANSVTGAKFNADVISSQTELATTPADTDELLLSDAGVLKRIDYSHLKDGAGDLVKLGTIATNNSNVSSLTIDNCFSSTYDMYKIVGYHSATSGGAHNYFRWRTGGASGSSYTTSDYQWINEGAHIKSEPLYENYYNWNYTANHGRVGSALDVDVNSSYVTFDLLVSDPNTNVMSRAQVTGTSCLRMTADDKWTTHHVGITNASNVNATGFEMTVSTGSINYGRVTVYGLVQ